MGEVWRARDQKLGREVAIKTLPEEFARDEERLARFEREARLLVSLNHPNIAAIYGLEEDHGIRYLGWWGEQGQIFFNVFGPLALPVTFKTKKAAPADGLTYPMYKSGRPDSN
jgi:serine/threonine protein kinase